MSSHQSRTRRVGLRALTPVFILGVVFGEARAQADEIPDHIRNALSVNAAALRQFTVKSERRHSSSLPAEIIPERLGVLDGHVFLSGTIEVEYILQAESYYEKHAYRKPQPRGEPQVRVRETSFNGELYYNGTGVEIAKTGAFPVLSIERPAEVIERDGRDSRVIDTSYFDNVGIRVPFRLSMLGSSPQSAILLEADDPANEVRIRKETLADRECTVVEVIKDSDRLVYYLDPEYNFAVRRREERTDTGTLKMSCDNDSFVRIAGTQARLPKRCDETYFYSPYSMTPGPVSEAPLFRTRTVVSQLSTSPVPTEKFTLRYEVPGTIIGDGTLPGAKDTETGRIDYRVPAHQEHLDKVIAAAVQRQGYIPIYKRGWFIISVIVVSVCAIFVFAWRSWVARAE